MQLRYNFGVNENIHFSLRINMNTKQSQFDQIFRDYDHTHTPGCALAVVRNDEIIYQRGYGMANLEYPIPIRIDTIFDIASVSKQFTALAFTLLVHEGLLSLEDDVREYVPELADYGEKITLKHLIYHTSGLRDQWELLLLAGWRWDDVITMEDILDLVSKQKSLNHIPGHNFLYCNTGYTLLAVVVQRVTGKSLRDFCDERLFKPLGMKNTHFHDDHTEVVMNRAYSYVPAGGNHYRKAVLNYANIGAAGLFTTVEDMTLWDREFYEGKVFGKAVIDEMLTPGKLNDGETLDYARGLQIAAYRGLKIVEHGGATAGYRAHLLRFPEQNFSVILFSNLGTVSPGDLARKVADIFLEEQLGNKMPQLDAIELPSEELEKFAGMYFNEKEQLIRRLYMRDGRLVLARGAGLQLEPIAENEFRVISAPEVKIKFKEAQGDIQLILSPDAYGRRPFALARVQEACPDQAELVEYTGTYTSPELDISYRLLVEDGILMLQRRKYGKQPLAPTFKDSFTQPGFDSHIYFTRNSEGQLEGMQISWDHVKKMKFLKTSE
jgi:CubicO group peptidase (beta-lactamase class C family)